MGLCICELRIELSSAEVPLLYDSNHLVYEIENACASHDKHRLFEAYTKAIAQSADKGNMIDSTPYETIEEEIRNRAAKASKILIDQDTVLWEERKSQLLIILIGQEPASEESTHDELVGE